MRARAMLIAGLVVGLLPAAALATTPATWSYDGTDTLSADAAGTVTVTVSLDDPDAIRSDQPLAFRHVLADGASQPRAGVQVGWTHGSASGTATLDEFGSFVVPDSFTRGATPALGGSGEATTLELTLPAGDYGLFSELVDATPQVVRRSGSGRYETAAEVSRTTFPRGVDYVYIASGESYPDALAAGPVAAYRDAPLLLTLHDRLPDVTRAELKRLQAGEIILLGGTSTIWESVEDELQPYAGTVRRIAGKNRYITAALAANDVWWHAGVPSPGTAYIATGESYPDAIAAGARAAAAGVPVLLVYHDAVPEATKTSIAVLKIDHVVVVGGAGSVNTSTYAELKQLAGSAERKYGSGRIETATAVADRNTTGGTLIIATADDYPDALTAGPLAGFYDADMLLSHPASLEPEVEDRIAELAPTRVILLGGTGSLSAKIAAQVTKYLTALGYADYTVVTSEGSQSFTVS